jgi:WhiB family redox-sensing transcriptional regulator
MEEWRERARCRGMNPDVFFPQKGHRNRWHTTDEACEVCATCPVTEECLAFGLYELWGVWGGRPERSRRNLRRKLGLGRR